MKEAHKDNAALHEATLTRLNKLEEEIKDVRRQASRSPVRYPGNSASPGLGARLTGPTNFMASRSDTVRHFMSLQDEMMIIMGDARPHSIEEELMSLLDRLGVKDQVHSVAVPCSARFMLHITENLRLALSRKKTSEHRDSPQNHGTCVKDPRAGRA